MSNHLGNVLAVITDRKWGVDDGVYTLSTGVKTASTPDKITDYYLPTIVSYSDYDPFGTMQSLRNNGEVYRFGFQGQERDDEIKGAGNSINYEYRMHDPRIGRFFAVDPLADKYPYYSSYQFSGNRVIDMIELEGLEPSESGSYAGEQRAAVPGNDPSKNNMWRVYEWGEETTDKMNWIDLGEIYIIGLTKNGQMSEPSSKVIPYGVSEMKFREEEPGFFRSDKF